MLGHAGDWPENVGQACSHRWRERAMMKVDLGRRPIVARGHGPRSLTRHRTNQIYSGSQFVGLKKLSADPTLEEPVGCSRPRNARQEPWLRVDEAHFEGQNDDEFIQLNVDEVKNQSQIARRGTYSQDSSVPKPSLNKMVDFVTLQREYGIMPSETKIRVSRTLDGDCFGLF